MDRDFIEKNQIVERCLLGKLPPKGGGLRARGAREPTLVDGRPYRASTVPSSLMKPAANGSSRKSPGSLGNDPAWSRASPASVW